MKIFMKSRNYEILLKLWKYYKIRMVKLKQEKQMIMLYMNKKVLAKSGVIIKKSLSLK